MVSLFQFTSQCLLFLLIAGMAGSCDARLCFLQFRKAKGIVCGLCCHFLIMPLLGYLCVDWLFPQPAVTAVTLLVITTSPSGGFSGFWCSVMNADLALSVAVTTASTVAACAALPLNLYLYVDRLSGKKVTLDWWQIVVSVSVVIVAVAVGLVVSLRLERPGRSLVNKCGTLAGVALMAMSFLSNSFADDPHDRLWNKPLRWFVGVCLPVPIGLGCTFALSRVLQLRRPEATTVAIECVYQNTGLALAIALSAFPRSEASAAAAVPLVYGAAEIVFIFLFGVVAWRMGWTHAPSSDPFCKMVHADYQPDATPDDIAELRMSDANLFLDDDALDAPLVAAEAGSPSPEKASPRGWFAFLRRSRSASASSAAAASLNAAPPDPPLRLAATKLEG